MEESFTISCQGPRPARVVLVSPTLTIVEIPEDQRGGVVGTEGEDVGVLDLANKRGHRRYLVDFNFRLTKDGRPT